MKKVTVIQSEKEVPLEILATSIQKISKSMDEIKKSRLTDRAIMVLMKDLTKLSERDIRRVMDSLLDLERVFIKKDAR